MASRKIFAEINYILFYYTVLLIQPFVILTCMLKYNSSFACGAVMGRKRVNLCGAAYVGQIGISRYVYVRKIVPLGSSTHSSY